MPAIRINQFGGIMPRQHPTLLPQNAAQRAHNCVLKDGKLAPLREPSKLAAMPIQFENGLTRVGDAGTIYLWRHGEGATMLAWPGTVWVAEGNLTQDNLWRLFVTGDTGIADNHPCMYVMVDDEIVRHDIVKPRMPAPVIVAEPPADPANERYTVFRQTWLDRFGMESPPSPMSDEVAYNDGQTIGVQSVAAPAGAVKRRIWKVVTGTQTEQMQFVAEQDLIAGSGFFTFFRFDALDENAGEILTVTDGVPPGLVGMTRVPGDFYAGWLRDNPREIRYCEAGYPSFWPEDYGDGVNADIVGLGVTLNSVFIMTRGHPWMSSGTGPASMSISMLASPQGCVSAKGICVMEGAVFYAGNGGVCMAQDGSAGVPVITDKIFTREQWQSLGPNGCRMVSHNSTLFIWFDSQKEGYMISMKDDAVAAVTTHDEAARAVCHDVVDDKLYFVRKGGV